MAVKILIPYNFKPNDKKAVHYTGQRYRREKEVEITLFHAFASVPEINVKNNTIMGKKVQYILFAPAAGRTQAGSGEGQWGTGGLRFCLTKYSLSFPAYKNRCCCGYYPVVEIREF
jgi:hypothetical protein